MKKPLVLMILDGFGIAPKEGNAIVAASTPNLDRILKENPVTKIGASGLDVGLPDGQMGNSEVGHTNIGAGRIVYQELTRITQSTPCSPLRKTARPSSLWASYPTAACTAITPTCTPF